MDAPKKNPDKLNTIGIVTVGAVGSALVYLSIVGLQAFYVNETSAVDEVAAFGDQALPRTSLKSAQVGKITEPRRMGWNGADGKPVVSIPIERAKQLIAQDAKVDAGNLVPVVGRSDKGTIQPIFGRPVALPPPPPPPEPVDPTGAIPGGGGGKGVGGRPGCGCRPRRSCRRRCCRRRRRRS